MLYLQRLPTRWQQFSGPLLIAFLSTLLFVLEPHSSDALAYQRDALSWQEVWRWISGHVVHTNGAHLMLNLTGLAMLWLLHGHYYSLSTFFGQLLLYAFAVTGCIFVFHPELQWYVGLSGVLHGIFVWGAVQDIRRLEMGGKLLFLGVWVKIAYEQFYGGSADVAALINARVATEAHLYGALTGLAACIPGIVRSLATAPSKGA